jgi:hypothetical protein
MDQNTAAPSGLFELELDQEARNTFQETAKWIKFFSIIAIILLGLFFLIMLAFGTRIATVLGEAFPLNDSGAGSMIIGVLVVVGSILGAMIYFLLKASNKIKTGVQTNSQADFNEGISALKTFFIIYGILSILSTVFSFTNLLNA